MGVWILVALHNYCVFLLKEKQKEDKKVCI